MWPRQRKHNAVAIDEYNTLEFCLLGIHAQWATDYDENSRSYYHNFSRFPLHFSYKFFISFVPFVRLHAASTRFLHLVFYRVSERGEWILIFFSLFYLLFTQWLPHTAIHTFAHNGLAKRLPSNWQRNILTTQCQCEAKQRPTQTE